MPSHYLSLNKSELHNDKYPECVTPIYLEDVRSIKITGKTDYYFFTTTTDHIIDLTNSRCMKGLTDS
jgi:hypothetical protein